MTTRRIQCRRIYDDPSPDDGFRVLVDRLWPRGVRKEDAQLDQWAKDLAPSTELRKWFHHDSSQFDAFAEQYREELQELTPALKALLDEAGTRTLTLLYAARNTEHNHANVLRDVLHALD